MPSVALRWTDWSTDPLVLAALAASAGAYLAIARRFPPRRRQPLAFWAGEAALVLALLSPLDAGAAYLFPVHMLQHMLLLLIAAALFALAVPPDWLGVQPAGGAPGGPRGVASGAGVCPLQWHAARLAHPGGVRCDAADRVGARGGARDLRRHGRHLLGGHRLAGAGARAGPARRPLCPPHRRGHRQFHSRLRPYVCGPSALPGLHGGAPRLGSVAARRSPPRRRADVGDGPDDVPDPRPHLVERDFVAGRGARPAAPLRGPAAAGDAGRVRAARPGRRCALGDRDVIMIRMRDDVTAFGRCAA